MTSIANQASKTPLPNNLNDFVKLFIAEKQLNTAVKLQSRLGNAWQNQWQQGVINEASSTSDLMKSRQEACKAAGANGWLTCKPSSPDTTVKDSTFRTAVCVRLNMSPVHINPDIHGDLKCADCKVSLVEEPFHRTHCKVENGKGRRLQHNKVVARIVSFARQCGHGADSEVKMFQEPNSKERPDGLIYWSNGKHTLFDVRGYDPLAPSYLSMGPQAKAKEAELSKKRKYVKTGKKRFPDMEFKAFIFNTLSGLSQEAKKLVQDLARTGPVSRDMNFKKMAQQELAAISVSIQSDNASIIRASFADAQL